MNAANNFINYGYLADGQKRQKAYFDPVNAPNTATTHYRGTMVFNDNGIPDYVLHPEGMAVHTGNNEWQWHFNLTDYLGNTRAVLDENGEIIQQTDYYPFGTAFALDNAAKNKYLYGGKELQSESLGGVSLGLYDFEARFFDPNIGSWPTLDPLAEKYYRMSPYVYCANNPVNVVDPDGRDIIVLQSSKGGGRMGHQALLIGNSKAGWTYISKDGYAGKFSFQSSPSKYVVESYNTVEDFANSPHNFELNSGTHSTTEGKSAETFDFKTDGDGNKVQRYDNALLIETTQSDGTSTDSKAMSAAIATAKDNYQLTVSDCSDVVTSALDVSKNSSGQQVKNGEEETIPLGLGNSIRNMLNEMPRMKFSIIQKENPKAIRYDNRLKP